MKKLIRYLAIVFLVFSMMIPSYASELETAKDKENDLQNQMNEAEAEKQEIAEKLKSLSASMKISNENLTKKKDEIEAAEQEVIMAKIEEDTQYESMKIRIKYMYENGNVSLLQVLLESESISDFLNKAEYIVMMSKYDRERLKDFQRALQKVEEKEVILEEEYKELEEIQLSLANQKAEAEELLAKKDSELEQLESDLKDIREQIKAAEEAERKRQEAEEAEKKRQEAEEAENNASSNNSKPNNSTSNNSTSNNSTSNGSSSGGQTKPPVVSGNGYFTHPCPGMSYQSSYFGEVRQGIGDTRPHKGHDYAAPEGTAIYAAASGTVVIAGYSYSAGYWVVINHGNGLTTKYMHMFEMPYVSAGETVVKGQHIGGVGTTGQSFGNHLHFQVEEDGVAVNPSKYL